MPDHDLRDRADVSRLVVEFYDRAFADELLGPVFVDVARMDLAAHLPIMCDFWETVLFRAGTYRRNAFTVHVGLHRRPELGDAGLTAAMFDRWLAIWTATVDELFAGPVADRAKLQATRIAGSIHRRLHAQRDLQTLQIEVQSPAPQDVVFGRSKALPPDASQHRVSAGTPVSGDHEFPVVSETAPNTWRATR